MPAMERIFGWNWRLRRVSRHNIVQNRTVAHPTRFERGPLPSEGEVMRLDLANDFWLAS
jgi:hypothetical protein